MSVYQKITLSFYGRVIQRQGQAGYSMTLNIRWQCFLCDIQSRHNYWHQRAVLKESDGWLSLFKPHQPLNIKASKEYVAVSVDICPWLNPVQVDILTSLPPCCMPWCLCKVPRIKDNQAQHMKLQHCSYITQWKVQHFLTVQKVCVKVQMVRLIVWTSESCCNIQLQIRFFKPEDSFMYPVLVHVPHM